MKKNKKKNENRCATPYCRGHRIDHHKHCPKCRSKRFKEMHPEAYHYNILKQNAKRRGHQFELSMDDFVRFCQETNYMKLKGKTAESASIDRINPQLGYVPGNLQILTLSANSKKRFEDEEKCPY